MKPNVRGIFLCLLHLGAILAFNLDASGARDFSVTISGAEMSSSNRVYRFNFSSNAGWTYPVETSTNMVNWTLLTNIVGTGGVLRVEDQPDAAAEKRFYHVGIVPKQPTPISDMVFIAPATFTMGSADTEPGRDAREGPLTVVTISRGYWIGKYEVAQTEYVAVTGANNSLFIYDGRLPVDWVNWNQATNFCHKLTARESAAGRLPDGYRYRLPTEAEWEYACRAGKKTPVSVGDGNSLSSAQANFDGAFPYGSGAKGPFLNQTTIVGVYAPNAWGLYDMHGNVWEWCQDIYDVYPGGAVTDPKGAATGTMRVLRGGGMSSVGQGCRSAKRDPRSPTYSTVGMGFRVVLARDP
ncbi:MAG TPA: formylglycine-generating enzyme family protein [Verrucomicrobiae bacterium]|nr:formylglycine-generating enzyme family protein [Verrucomicrobiae bacterium]